jgi:hypothetical protein
MALASCTEVPPNFITIIGGKPSAGECQRRPRLYAVTLQQNAQWGARNRRAGKVFSAYGLFANFTTLPVLDPGSTQRNDTAPGYFRWVTSVKEYSVSGPKRFFSA